MKTYYNIIIPFHFYENRFGDEIVFRKQTLEDARKVADNFLRYLKFDKEKHFDSAARILKFYDYYGEGLPVGKPQIVKVEETNIEY